jgi:hypothetical protein
MFEFTIDAGRLTDWLSLGVSTLAFTSGLIVLWMAKRNIDALLAQIRSQSANQAIEAHKTLYMPIVQDPALAEMIAGDDHPKYRKNMLVSMMINHASRLFFELNQGHLTSVNRQDFEEDLLDLFSSAAVRERWPNVRSFHNPGFVDFVDGCLARSAPKAPAERRLPEMPKVAKRSRKQVARPSHAEGKLSDLAEGSAPVTKSHNLTP